MLISLLINKLRTWLLYRATLHELKLLNERSLSDIGIDPSDLDEIAYRAALRVRTAPHGARASNRTLGRLGQGSTWIVQSQKR
jgi:uncharacterized protein YjiS (DUF1127 family)